MQHIHLDESISTQTHLMEHFEHIPSHLLISCENQTGGHGRRGAKWDSYLLTLCFSATISPQKNISLTALEIPLLVKNFFLKEFKKELSLKWPNDLMRENKKCGGIILNSSSSENMVLGLGLNIGLCENLEDYPIPATSVFDSSIVFSKRSLALKIYRYMLDNRLSEKQIIQGWSESCVHINKDVSIHEDSTEHKGKFIGIGANGQAQLEIDSQIKEFFTGTLRF